MEELSRGVANAYRLNIIATKDFRSPVKMIQNTSFMHIRSQDIFIVALTKHNVDASMVFETLNRIAEIFRGYFGGKLDEEAVRNHLTLTYEILDEIMDYGYPQNLSLDTLKPFIFQKGAIRPEKLPDSVAKITNMVTGACPWRNPETFYKKNELYIDVIESVNLLVSTDGKRLRADVSGSIQIKCYLSGVPECKFGLNDKVVMDKEKKSTQKSKTDKQGIEIDDCNFHTCVRLSKFDTERTISFIPPDGEFELMKYRTTENVEVPFTVTPIVKEHSKTRLEVKVAVKSNFRRDQFGTGVKVKIPLPQNTAIVKVHTQNGHGKYRPEEGGIIWKIKKFPGETKYILAAEIELAASVTLQKKAWSRPPISMEFQVPMFAASGLHVRFLKVLEQKQQYQAVKWVRYLTQAGNYQYRI